MNIASILKKVLMAVTGLAMIGFLAGHLSGNTLLFKGSEAFNNYAELLAKTGALLYVVEVGLIAIFLLHIYSAVNVTLKNRDARGAVRYAVSSTGGRATFASRSMMIGGIILAVFVVTHVWMFKYGPYETMEGGLWGLVVQTFKNPLMVLWYVVAMLALGLHLGHGFASAFQTLGALKPDWQPKLKTLGLVFGWVVAAGFISMPIVSFFML